MEVQKLLPDYWGLETTACPYCSMVVKRGIVNMGNHFVNECRGDYDSRIVLVCEHEGDPFPMGPERVEYFSHQSPYDRDNGKAVFVKIGSDRSKSNRIAVIGQALIGAQQPLFMAEIIQPTTIKLEMCPHYIDVAYAPKIEKRSRDQKQQDRYRANRHR